MIKAAKSFAITFLIGAITFILPDRAAASTYEWNATGGGNWATPGNWLLVDGPAGAGYPNQPGDLARFNPSSPSVDRTITINEPISLAMLVITDSKTVHLSGNSNGRLVFDSTLTGADAMTAMAIQGTGQHIISVPIILADPLAVGVNNATGRLTCLGAIMQTIGSPGVIKEGPGTLTFAGVMGNSYTGLTHVRAGVLELWRLNALAIYGPLRIGAGTSSTPTAIVRLLDDDQIRDVQSVTIMGDGVFETGPNSESINELTVNNGKVAIGDTPTQNAVFTPFSINMTGGTIQIARESALALANNVTVTSSTVARALFAGEGSVRMNTTTRQFVVGDGPQPVDVEIQTAITGAGSAGFEKGGAGTLRFTTATENDYPGTTTVIGGRLELARVNGESIPGALRVGQAASLAVLANHNITDSSAVTVSSKGEFRVDAIEKINHLDTSPETLIQVGVEATGDLTTRGMTLLGSRVEIFPSSVLHLAYVLGATSSGSGIVSTIAGEGTLALEPQSPTPNIFEVADGPAPIDLQISCRLTGGGTLNNIMSGAVRIDGSGDYAGRFQHAVGGLFINGSLPNATIALGGGRLGGNGRTGPIELIADSTIAPGLSPGILTTANLAGDASLTLFVELSDAAPGTGYDQLKVIGSVTLNGAELVTIAEEQPPPFSRFILIDNDGSDPIIGEFEDLPEGATYRFGDQDFKISYRGGDGNDVVLSSVEAMTWFLAEGATGGFFDDDVLIANPTTTEAPVTMTFLLEGGGTVVERRTIAPQSRMTVHVDRLAGLEETSPSVQVTSDNSVPLVVERTMFWDPTYYGGHTANAVARPEVKWVFAEGFQGFFDTYVLIANANAEPTEATITFLRENDTPVVKTVPVGAFARKTVYAGDYSEVVGRAFGIVVEATRPVIAERAMYFASQPGRLWAGGHANTGIASPSMSWFHPEGATGTFFNTFILLSNPQDAPAHVTLRFLLSTGDVIVREKTVEPRQRMTINPAVEGDPRLENAALSTVVQSDVPIVSERSMYWPGEALPFGEGHNSAGVVTTGTHWGLAEGRVGGPQQFQTYVLLANPETTAAEVTVTFLRENGTPPVVKNYRVPATSRFNIDLATVLELSNESFGVRIDVTNGVNVAVERSLYWNANGVFWSGGTNALAAPLP